MKQGMFFVDGDGVIVGIALEIWKSAYTCDADFREQGHLLCDAIINFCECFGDEYKIIRCEWSDMGAWNIQELVTKD